MKTNSEYAVDKLPLPQVAIDYIKEMGITTLHPPQALAVKKGLLQHKSMVVAIPTAAGKTLIGLMAALKVLLEGKGKVLYLSPLRALALEKYEEFKNLEALGFNVRMSSGDFDSQDSWLKNAHFIITTNEKLDAFLRHHVSWLLSSIGLVIIDEGHLIASSDRGPTLEVVITKLRRLHPNAQYLLLSATIQNAQDLADWLQAELVTSDWRPIPLKEGVLYDKKIFWTEKDFSELNSDYKNDIDAIIEDTLKNNAQILLFANTRAKALKLCKQVRRISAKLIDPETITELRKLAESVEGSEDDPIVQELKISILNAAAFHHAGLLASQRKIVERGFKAGYIKILTATPTLAAGVNIPARRVVITSVYRYSDGYSRKIPVMDYKQMSGRAGRPKYDPYGEAVILARKPEDISLFFSRYINGQLEKIDSKLASQTALRKHILSIINDAKRLTFQELIEFFSNTFYGKLYGLEGITANLMEVAGFLADNNLITIDYGTEMLIITPLGKRVCELYIDPLSAVIIQNGLYEWELKVNQIQKEHLPLILLDLISSTPDMPSLRIPNNFFDDLRNILFNYSEELLYEIPEYYEEIKMEFRLKAFYTAYILNEWINEVPIQNIVRKYNIHAGDIARLAENGEWLLYSLKELLKVQKKDLSGLVPFLDDVEKLIVRVKIGIKEELVELVKIPNIGRVRARILKNAGITSLEDLKNKPISFFVDLPGFGQKLGKKILTYLHEQHIEELSALKSAEELIEYHISTRKTTAKKKNANSNTKKNKMKKRENTQTDLRSFFD